MDNNLVLEFKIKAAYLGRFKKWNLNNKNKQIHFKNKAKKKQLIVDKSKQRTYHSTQRMVVTQFPVCWELFPGKILI